MLENDGLLPLDPTDGPVAVIGPKADLPRGQLGDYAYRSLFRSGRGTEDIETRLAGIEAATEDDVAVTHAQGCSVIGASRDGFDGAIEAAADAAVALVFVGGFSGRPDPPGPLGDPAADPAAEAGSTRSGLAQTSGEKADRCRIDLPGVQDELIRAIEATGTPTGVVVVSGRPHPLPWAKDHVGAILHAWLPGVAGGGGIADVLFGDVSPRARLPITVPRSVCQLPVHYRRHPNAMDHAFVDETDPVLWPFGFGRTYTEFAYPDVRLPDGTVTPGGTCRLEVAVENVGAVNGVEVIQVYGRHHHASVARPDRELLGFRPVELAPGERATVSVAIDAEQLGVVGRDGTFAIEPGAVDLLVGRSAADVIAEEEVTVTGSRTPVDHRGAYLASTAVDRAE